MIGSSSDMKSASLVKQGGKMMCIDGTCGGGVIEKEEIRRALEYGRIVAIEAKIISN